MRVMGKYSEYDRASMSVAWRVALWIIGIVVFAGLLSGGVLLVKALISEQKGALDAEIQINKGTNQIQSQELFQDLYAKIQEYDSNLDVAAEAVAQDPTSFNKTNLQGLKMTCNAAVQQYNSEAGKISRGKWMSADLPYEIDQTDPRFDCKETGK